MRSTSDTSSANARSKPAGTRSARQHPLDRPRRGGRRRPHTRRREHADAVEEHPGCGHRPRLAGARDETAVPEQIGRMLIGAAEPLVAADTRQHDRRAIVRHARGELAVAQPESRLASCLRGDGHCPGGGRGRRSRTARKRTGCRSAALRSRHAALRRHPDIHGASDDRCGLRRANHRCSAATPPRRSMKNRRRRSAARRPCPGRAASPSPPSRTAPASALHTAPRRRTAARGEDRCPSGASAFRPGPPPTPSACARQAHAGCRRKIVSEGCEAKPLRRSPTNPMLGLASTPFARSSWRGSVANRSEPPTAAYATERMPRGSRASINRRSRPFQSANAKSPSRRGTRSGPHRRCAASTIAASDTLVIVTQTEFVRQLEPVIEPAVEDKDCLRHSIEHRLFVHGLQRSRPLPAVRERNGSVGVQRCASRGRDARRSRSCAPRSTRRPDHRQTRTIPASALMGPESRETSRPLRVQALDKRQQIAL